MVGVEVDGVGVFLFGKLHGTTRHTKLARVQYSLINSSGHPLRDGGTALKIPDAYSNLRGNCHMV
jgi:hypothetical protein